MWVALPASSATVPWWSWMISVSRALSFSSISVTSKIETWLIQNCRRWHEVVSAFYISSKPCCLRLQNDRSDISNALCENNHTGHYHSKIIWCRRRRKRVCKIFLMPCFKEQNKLIATILKIWKFAGPITWT